jgi:acylphosphatase
MTTCKHVYYSGRVQGVGFRYTAQRLAERYPVAGYVRNVSNGDVELLAEGPAEEVQAFLDALARHMAGYIQQTRANDEAPTGLQGFQIRH